MPRLAGLEAWKSHAAMEDINHDHLTPYAQSSFVESGSPAVMLINGATAKKEFCLVAVRSGQDLGIAPALEPCEEAVRHADGREIWRITPQGQLVSEFGHLCLASGGQSTTALHLGDCDQEDSQNSTWEVTGDNQIKLADAGSLCLSFDGAPLTSPTIDVALGQEVDASSMNDSWHGPERAVDESSSSYWASAAVQDGETVTWSVSFPLSPVRSIEVAWEFPPDVFDLQITDDGQTWNTVYSVKGNPLHAMSSHIELGVQLPATGARLLLRKTDSHHGSHAGAKLFGIRSFKIFASGQQAILEQCKLPGKQARDRWFLSSVSQFDPAGAVLPRRRRARWHPNRLGADDSWVPQKRGPFVASFLSSNEGTDDASSISGHLRQLTQWRQLHRRTLDGFLCAAASVQDSQVFTGCTNMPTPSVDVGREWCYLDSQILQGLPDDTAKWGYCADVVDYDAMRREQS